MTSLAATAQRASRVPASAFVTGVTAVVVAGTGFANGGYFPTSWGWIALALAWILLLVLLTGDVAVGRLGAAFVLATFGFAAWVWLSLLWTTNTTQTVLEGERVLVYLAAAGCLVAIAPGRQRALLGGCLIGVFLPCVYGLATRLFPERLATYDGTAGYRLATPLGYWNALGLFAAIGILLALGFVAHDRSRVVRCLAAGSLVLFFPTLQFTFSRGAWLSLVIGLAALVALDTRRLVLVGCALAAAFAPAVGVYLGWRSGALNTVRAPLDEAAAQGHRLALELAILAVVAALVVFVLHAAQARLVLPRRADTAFTALLVVTALVVCAGVIIHTGSPWAIGRRAWRSFDATPSVSYTNLNQRLFSFSSSGRTMLWRVAIADFGSNRIVGSGAGTYERYWLRHRPLGGKVRDAHSLYVEVLAELGIVGLALLATALALPLGALRRVRRRPWAPAAAAAYVAYLVHAGVDWDWEMVCLTGVAFALGVALVAGEETQRVVVGARLWSAVAVTAAVAVVAFVALVGNLEVGRAKSAAFDGRWPASAHAADKSRSWMPWSTEPARLLGEARLNQGRAGDAAESFRSALRRDPGDWSLWLDLARATRGAERTTALARATALDPLSPEIVEFEAELRQERGA